MLVGVAIPTRLDQSLGTIAVYSARFQRPAPNGIPPWGNAVKAMRADAQCFRIFGVQLGQEVEAPCSLV
jgi:hypothetical protein